MSKPLGLRSKPAADKSPFGCKLCIPYRLRTLADSLGEDSLNVACCICWIEHVHEHDSDLREMSLQLLSTCVAQNESDFVERLAQALREEHAETRPGGEDDETRMHWKKLDGTQQRRKQDAVGFVLRENVGLTTCRLLAWNSTGQSYGNTMMVARWYF